MLVLVKGYDLIPIHAFNKQVLRMKMCLFDMQIWDTLYNF